MTTLTRVASLGLFTAALVGCPETSDPGAVDAVVDPDVLADADMTTGDTIVADTLVPDSVVVDAVPGDGITDDVPNDDGVLPEDIASDDGGCPPTPSWTPIANEPSVATVTFELNNPGTETVYVGLEGEMCEGWGLKGLHTVGWFNCGCECAAPLFGTTNAVLKVEAGATGQIVWDGRALYKDPKPLNCCEEGWGGEVTTEDVPYTKPAPAGPREFYASVFPELPDGCWENPDGTVDCSNGGTVFDPDGIPWSKASLCEDVTAVVRTTFDVPSSGSATVAVDLSTAEPLF